MLEYMSAREAALKWGISERRVHKLCGDGRISGLIRFGRSWGIPFGSEKPGDARDKARMSEEESHSAPAPEISLLGPDARLIAKNGACSVFRLENGSGGGTVTVYNVFNGISLMFSELKMSMVTGHDDRSSPKGSEILTINHCQGGRFECEFPWGECGYIGEGDMAVSQMPPPMRNSNYPLKNYYGISIMIDIGKACQSIEAILTSIGIARVDLRAIKNKLLGKRPFLIIRSSDALTHIFSELYSAPDDLKESYIRLKLIELLLFLSVIEPENESGRKYFLKSQVIKVKAICEHMTAHLDRQYTLSELSSKWNIPLTALKSCFKSIYGASIHAYMRDYRMQAASYMLLSSNEPIAEIAAKVGYDSHAQFSAAFKEATGASPSSYRKVAVQNKQSPPESDNKI